MKSYPIKTIGSQIARAARVKSNALTSNQRQILIDIAMELIEKNICHQSPPHKHSEP